MGLKDTTGIWTYPLLVQHFLGYFYGIIFYLVFSYYNYVAKNLKLMLVPLSLYTLLACTVFWNSYHAGILACFYLFLVWQVFANKEKLKEVRKAFKTEQEYELVQAFMLGLVFLTLSINLRWSFIASQNDILYKTDISHGLATYIIKNHLSQKKIWVAWQYTGNDDEVVKAGSYAVNAYFNQNILQNINGGLGEKHGYLEYRVIKKDDYIVRVRSFGPPDFVIGKPNMNDIFVSAPIYIPIKKFSSYEIWKDSMISKSSTLYMREDLLNTYPQFKEIQE